MSQKGLLKNPFILFIVFAGVFYLAWYFAYHYFINPNGYLDRLIIDNLVYLSREMLSMLGYDLIPMPAVTDNIRRTTGLWIGDPCNGLNLFVLFSVFIAFYPGNWKNKLWYIPIGIISIHFINLLRIVALCVIQKIDERYLDFQHDYTFTVVVYGYMFFLWMIWANKFSGMSAKKVAK